MYNSVKYEINKQGEKPHVTLEFEFSYIIHQMHS